MSMKKAARFLLHQSLILLCILHSICANPAYVNYVSKSCKTTQYPKLCIKTLSKHAGEIKSSPKRLAVTALVSTFNATQTTSKVLRELPGGGPVVSECVEVVSDAVYELRRSLKRLNQSRKGTQFSLQINDVQTWVSAALTDDDTCLDDFTAKGRSRILARGFVLTVARLTSIALTFINKYANI
ncbi:pectinesterase inhibitor 10-like [Salvia miltiorrhiza]|uniref:pectinesterase inhibitor 10-like n=1 Tax=Salvia miltiorrhiza TaxID=226208 RepID=UPI0025AB8E39|nr:pectinesterase inhibitor 10-like [Salvia miltiorrhiza]